MRKFSLNKYLEAITGIVLVLVIWLAISFSIDERTMVFPDPWKTVEESFRLLGTSYTWSCIGFTLLRVVIGFAISFALALVLGILAGNISFIRGAFKPILSVLKSIPTAALVFMFLVLVGARRAPVMMVVLISFPILYEAVVTGIQNIDESVMMAARVDGASGIKLLGNIELPNIGSYLAVGVASSLGLSFKIEIMAEILTGDTKNGLGSAILAAQRNDPTNMVPIFAYSLIAILMSALVSFSLLLFKKYVLRLK
ncbi:MAG: ABC transporter permease subunit [Bacilli bacterium]|nr:ABC transporter permease subunit [Bacilli bacterium]